MGEGGSTESKTMDAFQTEEWEVDDVLEVRVNKKQLVIYFDLVFTYFNFILQLDYVSNCCNSCTR